MGVGGMGVGGWGGGEWGGRTQGRFRLAARAVNGRLLALAAAGHGRLSRQAGAAAGGARGPTAGAGPAAAPHAPPEALAAPRRRAARTDGDAAAGDEVERVRRRQRNLLGLRLWELQLRAQLHLEPRGGHQRLRAGAEAQRVRQAAGIKGHERVGNVLGGAGRQLEAQSQLGVLGAGDEGAGGAGHDPVGPPRAELRRQGLLEVGDLCVFGGGARRGRSAGSRGFDQRRGQRRGNTAARLVDPAP
jgi:hypothetical protein